MTCRAARNSVKRAMTSPPPAPPPAPAPRVAAEKTPDKRERERLRSARRRREATAAQREAERQRSKNRRKKMTPEQLKRLSEIRAQRRAEKAKGEGKAGGAKAKPAATGPKPDDPLAAEASADAARLAVSPSIAFGGVDPMNPNGVLTAGAVGGLGAAHDISGVGSDDATNHAHGSLSVR